jgi:putative transposase
MRKVTYKLYPNKTQDTLMMDLLIHHQQLYNWALKDRIETYQQFSYGLTFSDQCAINTLWRNRRKQYGLLNTNAQSEQVTLKRVALAFEGFFRRLKANKGKAGFPRFKSVDRYKGWGYKAYGDGWKLHLNPKKHGVVYLADVGMVKIRGQARNENGTPKTCEVIKKADGWYLSVTFDYPYIDRTSGKQAFGLDWGVEYYMSAVSDNGDTHQIENPRFIKTNQEKLTALQRDLSLVQTGNDDWYQLKSRIARLHRKISQQRLNHVHQTTAQLVKEAGLLAIEQINVSNMTRSAKGTIEKPGKRVKQKSGLNRAILDTSPSHTYKILQYKAAEAGIEFVEVPSRKVKPSQTCPSCGQQIKKTLGDRVHSCDCGVELPRDIASAMVNLNWALFGNSVCAGNPHQVR